MFRRSVLKRKFLVSACQRFQSNKPFGIIYSKNEFEWTDKPHSYFLETNRIGPYTVCRTVNEYNIFKYDMHINRLIDTLNQNYQLYHCPNHDQSHSKPELSPSILYKTIMDTLYHGLHSFYNNNGKMNNDETRVMIYIDENKLFDKLCQFEHANNPIYIENIFKQCMITHFCNLPTLRKPISAIIRSCHDETENDNAMHIFESHRKDSQWFKDRKVWQKDELDKKLNINEVLMGDIETGYVLEGLSSTFGIIKDDGNLYTPSLDHVLDGTVRSFVIDVLNDYDKMNVIYQIPKLQEMDEWKAALIMSTSRMVLPIDQLYIDKNDQVECITFDNHNNQHLNQFLTFLNQKILLHSTPITKT